MKCEVCGNETGNNNIPYVCADCLDKAVALDSEGCVITKDEREVARRKARLESTTADNIGKE